jgi:hypothetical protein
LAAISSQQRKADMSADQTRRRSKMTLWAMCGRLRVGKDFLHERSIGRCSHVFGLWVRFT